MAERTKAIGLGLLVPAALLAAWYLATASGAIPAYQLPAPDAVWRAAVDLLTRGELGHHIAISTQRVLTGFVLGAVAGLAIGAAVGLSRSANNCSARRWARSARSRRWRGCRCSSCG